MHPFPLGPDTVELVKRTPTGAIGPDGLPERDETVTVLTDCSAREVNGREEVDGSTITVLDLDCHLPVVPAALALTPGDALRHRGRLFELQTPGVQHDDASGAPSHVRALGRWAAETAIEAGGGEQVTVIPAGVRNDDGTYEPDGAPFDVIARSVEAGASTERFGEGTSIEAEFTVTLDLGTPIKTGDWIVVRGLECRALVTRQESQWAERRELVVLAQFARGGRT